MRTATGWVLCSPGAGGGTVQLYSAALGRAGLGYVGWYVRQ